MKKAKTQSGAFRASEMSYRRLFEAARDGILILDMDMGRITDVNPFLVEMLGIPATNWSAKPLARSARSRTSLPIKKYSSGSKRRGMSVITTCR